MLIVKQVWFVNAPFVFSGVKGQKVAYVTVLWEEHLPQQNTYFPLSVSVVVILVVSHTVCLRARLYTNIYSIWDHFKYLNSQCMYFHLKLNEIGEEIEVQ